MHDMQAHRDQIECLEDFAEYCNQTVGVAKHGKAGGHWIAIAVAEDGVVDCVVRDCVLAVARK